jgi:electron transport complex protein RnfA
MEFIIALFSQVFIDNVILSGYKGLCSYVGISNKWSSAVGMGAALTLVSFIAGLICWGLQFLLNLLGIGYLQTIVFILVIAALVQMLEIVIKKFLPGLYTALGIYLPLITTNCVVLGLALYVSSYTGAQWQTVLGTCLGMPLGYYMVLIIFSAIQERLALSEPHRAFKGAALSFITTAFMAMAALGLSGMLG